MQLRKKRTNVADVIDKTDGNKIYLGNDLPRSLSVSLLYFALGVIFVVVVWQIIASTYNAYWSSILTFPTPVEAFGKLGEYIGGTKFLRYTMWEHLSGSLLRWMVGFTVAVAIGLTAGILMSTGERMYRFGMVPVSILQIIPGLAWLPVTILLFGYGDGAAIFIIAITVISPVAISVSTGLRRVPKVYKHIAETSYRSRLDTLLEIRLPFSLPDIVSGLRIGMANSWRMLIAAEMVVGVARGLGFAIQMSTDNLDYLSAFTCIIIICVIGLMLDKLLFANLERHIRNRMGADEEAER
ncbi:MAG: ABC transporter permease [Methanomassiliicoccaceae archaeon]|nr:ABC transporter permease [Methanomassiliicoccaceae archaeon]